MVVSIFDSRTISREDSRSSCCAIEASMGKESVEVDSMRQCRISQRQSMNAHDTVVTDIKLRSLLLSRAWGEC